MTVIEANKYRYECPYVQKKEDIPWSDIPAVPLVDTATEEQPRLRTTARACWSDDKVFVHFLCEDDHIVASYTERDDPLYEEDVVEVFIDEEGEGRHYIELELSPRNVLFDALIENDLAGTIKVDKEWDMAGIETNVRQNNAKTYIYDIAIPHGAFTERPRQGTIWKINFYRIDEDIRGERTYMAWSPTGKHNFHISQAFGELVFVDKGKYVSFEHAL